MIELGQMAAESSRLAALHELPMTTVEGVTGFVRCMHKHKFQGTAVFYQSLGVLQCNTCGGYQVIKKPLN